MQPCARFPLLPARQLKVPLHAMRAVDVPAAPSEREALIHLWERESLLSGWVLMIECDRLDSCERGTTISRAHPQPAGDRRS